MSQAAPGPPDYDISSPERCSTWGRVPQRPAYLNDYAFPMPFMCSKQSLYKIIYTSLSLFFRTTKGVVTMLIYAC